MHKQLGLWLLILYIVPSLVFIQAYMINCKLIPTRTLEKFASYRLWILVASVCFTSSFLFQACRTIAYFDKESFVETADLKAKTMVLLSHGVEDYLKYSEKIDEVMILSEKLYALQKSRELNYLSTRQWELLLRKTKLSNIAMLPDLFGQWKEKGKLLPFEVKFSQEQIEKAFDEILRLEGNKLKK